MEITSLMSSGHDSELRESIKNTMSEIFGFSQKWYEYLETQDRNERISYAILIGLMILFLTFFSRYFIEIVGYSQLQVFLAGLLLGVTGGVASYFIIERVQKPRFSELSDALAEMRRAKENQNLLEKTLHLIDRMTECLPEVKKRRREDSFMYGVAAFILVSFLRTTTFPGLNVLIGVLVWLYFRYEATKDYEREVSRFEEWRRRFEQQKRDFVEGL